MPLHDRKTLSCAFTFGLIAILAAPAAAQLRPKLDLPRAQLRPEARSVTLELGLTPRAAKAAARKPLRDVLDEGLVLRYSGKAPLPVRYVGLVVRNGRVVDRRVSSATILQPGVNRVPGDQFVPFGLTRGAGDQFIPGDQFVPGDQFIPGDQFVPGDQFQVRKGVRFLVLFAVPEDADMRERARTRPITVALEAP